VNDVRLEPKHHTIIATRGAEPDGRTDASPRQILNGDHKGRNDVREQGDVAQVTG
jgi:hypothetical protein